MPSLPILKPIQIIRALLKAGFFVHHQRGSHARLLHRIFRDRRVTILVHNRDLSPSILKIILGQAKLSVKEFLGLLKK